MSWIEDVICESLSDEQKEAVTSKHSRCVVVAGAGAGKTRVLVKRFLYTLFQLGMEPSNLREIVAITFTKKAAAEMRDRLRSEMERVVKVVEKKGLKKEYQIWNQVRQRLDEAQIYTIHAYCQSILTREPIVTGVDPFFEILEEYEADRLLEQSVTHILSSTELLHQRTSTEREWWVHYLSLIGWERAESVLLELSKKWSNLGWSLSDLIIQTNERLLQNQQAWLATMPQKMINPSQTEEYGVRFRDWIRVLQETKFSKATKWPQKVLDYWNEREGSFQNQMSFSDWTRWIKEIKKLLGKNHEIIDSIHKLFQQIELDFSAYFQYQQLQRSRESEDMVTRLLLNYLIEIQQHYQFVKKQLARLDYHDLIRILCEALEQNETFRYRIQQEIKALLIDEYQDTDGLQKRLVDLIVTTQQESKGSLFVVGDPKQSIYRFRGADVSIFLDTQKEMIAQGDSNVHLRHNYRSQSGIVQFTNELCKYAFPMEEYHSIQSSRPDNQTIEKPVQIIYSGLQAGMDVHLDKLSIEEREAIYICHQIKRLHKDKNNPKPYGSMVLLLRKMNDAAIYERVLRSHEIPARVVGGRGFYQIQEIQDFIYLFTTLLTPVSVEAWVGVLRSPFAFISEEGLTLLALETRWSGTPQDWWEQNILNKEDQHKLEQFLLLYQSLKRISLRRTPGQLIRWVMEQSSYVDVLWGLSDGAQAVANLEKWCADWESQSDPILLTLEGFLKQMELYQLKAEDESEAEIWDEGEDVVRIMTIHKSKGLEFPVVFLPNLQKASNKSYSQENALIHPTMGLVIKGFEHLEGLGDAERKVKFPCWEKAVDYEEELDAQELKRLFYVATTRAEDYLYLCLSPQEGKSKDNIASWLRDILRLDQYEGRPEILFGSCSLPIICDLDEEIDTHQASFTQPDSSLIQWTETEANEEMISFINDSSIPYTKPIPYGQQDHIPISVTDWKELVHCPRKYYYHQVIQVPIYHDQSPDLDDDFWGMKRKPSTSIPGNRRGEIIHYLCEKTLSLTERLWLQPDWMAKVAQIFHLTSSEIEILKSDLEQIRAHFLDSKVIQRVSEAKKVLTEKPFQYVTPGFRVNGQMDLLIQSMDNRWEIIDFKSDRMNVQDISEKTIFYLPQLQLYSLALRAKGVEVGSVTIYFLDCNHEMQIQIDEKWWAQTEALLTNTRHYFQYGKKLSNWTAKPSKICPYCEYNVLCEKAGTDS